MQQNSKKTMYKCIFMPSSIHGPPTPPTPPIIPRFPNVSKNFVNAAEAGIDH